jgi:hypothetical protein
MWRTQPAFAAKRRHTLPTPHLLGNQLPPLRPHFLASLLSRHPATLLHPHSPPQDALQVALTLDMNKWRRVNYERGTNRNIDGFFEALETILRGETYFSELSN